MEMINRVVRFSIFYGTENFLDSPFGRAVSLPYLSLMGGSPLLSGGDPIPHREESIAPRAANGCSGVVLNHASTRSLRVFDALGVVKREFNHQYIRCVIIESYISGIKLNLKAIYRNNEMGHFQHYVMERSTNELYYIEPILVSAHIDDDISTFVHRVDDNFEFKLGMMFNSKDEAFDIYNAYARNKGFGVRKVAAGSEPPMHIIRGSSTIRLPSAPLICLAGSTQHTMEVAGTMDKFIKPDI
ncbi:hypothetical protein RJ639_013470 [Escallonia herrerae]|uniref:Uncharacterized protein n=1 Tax=Escallonia herrerae TaxID=1293975 RepID=A0AA88VHH1_9ASTE|nr:hypothetical protein RJ639_013470 [Escallonia herrerae]